MQHLITIMQPGIHQDSKVSWEGVFEGDAVWRNLAKRQ
jgi:hypothetical protein